MSQKNRDNRSDRSRRDEPVNEIKKQILDAAPEQVKPTSSENRADEYRPDQVPGHLGYNTTDNLLNVNPETEKF